MSLLLRSQFTIETEQEEDGRWLAEVLELPGTLVYADSQLHAIQKVKVLALRVLADKLEQGEVSVDTDSFRFIAA
jgi:predicted RNase H-like HicB family nuclease